MAAICPCSCAALTTTLSDPEIAALGPGLVLTNPPYGVRVGDSGRLRDLYASLGNAMRGPLGGWSLGFVTSDPALAAATGLPLHSTLETVTGGLRIRLYATGRPGSELQLSKQLNPGP